MKQGPSVNQICFKENGSSMSMPTVTRQVVVSNADGLHARPAMEFVHTASGFTSSVRVEKQGDDPLVVDGKSIMEMMTLAAVQGTLLQIIADGDDAAAAVEKLAALFDQQSGEKV
jgi:phosphocarrier protein